MWKDKQKQKEYNKMRYAKLTPEEKKEKIEKNRVWQRAHKEQRRSSALKSYHKNKHKRIKTSSVRA